MKAISNSELRIKFPNSHTTISHHLLSLVRYPDILNFIVLILIIKISWIIGNIPYEEYQLLVNVILIFSQNMKEISNSELRTVPELSHYNFSPSSRTCQVSRQKKPKCQNQSRMQLRKTRRMFVWFWPKKSSMHGKPSVNFIPPKQHWILWICRWKTN